MVIKEKKVLLEAQGWPVLGRAVVWTLQGYPGQFCWSGGVLTVSGWGSTRLIAKCSEDQAENIIRGWWESQIAKPFQKAGSRPEGALGDRGS